MSDLKLLLVEDFDGDVQTVKSTINRYNREKNKKVELIEAKNKTEALQKLNNTFDGAIVDLKLSQKPDEGNDVVDEITTKYRIPVAVMTGTPQHAQKGPQYLGVFTKGETGYDDLLDLFFLVYETGITKILGGRGVLEQAMNEVFWNNILPNLNDWKAYKAAGKDTETALLRFTINHIVEKIDNDSKIYFPEEMYIVPPISKNLNTGSIVKTKENESLFIILSPSCDLALHNGKMKTDRILVCLIEPTNQNSLIKETGKNSKIEILEADDDEKKKKKGEKIEKAKRFLSQIATNNYSFYFHYLPETSLFKSGLINFRKIETYTNEDFNNKFEIPPYAQISMPFVKDIVSRFSNYYARQGQPDFDFDNLVKTLSGE
jgi:hypothetical protein